MNRANTFCWRDDGKPSEFHVSMLESLSKRLNEILQDLSWVKISIEWRSDNISKFQEESILSSILHHASPLRQARETEHYSESPNFPCVTGRLSSSERSTPLQEQQSETKSPVGWNGQNGRVVSLSLDHVQQSQDANSSPILVFKTANPSKPAIVSLASTTDSTAFACSHQMTEANPTSDETCLEESGDFTFSHRFTDTNSTSALETSGESLQIQQSAGSFSLQSLDANLPVGSNPAPGAEHVTRLAIAAMMATNALRLAESAHWLSCKGAELAIGVKQRKRDAYDNASKVTFSQKLASLGITAKQIVIDTAQAGGICGNADGFNMESREFFEVKGSCAKTRSDRVAGPNAQQQFTVQGVRFEGAVWSKLIMVGRGRTPTDWTSAADYDACGFWLGVASRGCCEQALTAAGKSLRDLHDVAVTPWTRDVGPVRHRSWLGPCIEWIRFKDLTRGWLKQHLGLN